VRPLRQAAAFLRRDLLLQSSYRSAFVLNLVGIFFSVAIFHYLGRLVDGGLAGKLGGRDYFSFVLWDSLLQLPGHGAEQLLGSLK
jgi:hypothetical protein